MPPYGHGHFIRRALESLRAQTLTDWELIVVDDGSPDQTADVVRPYLADARCSYVRLEENRGFGAALNGALDRARAPYIAYLPSDDAYYPEHLTSLVWHLEKRQDAIAAYAGARHHGQGYARGQIEGFPLQLVQVLHRRTADRWRERDELVSDQLDWLFWDKLRGRGTFVGTDAVTCEWVDHPRQQHKVIRESLHGGDNPYRQRYQVRAPLRFRSSEGDHVDEGALYRRFRERERTPTSPDGLRILIVGELAYNPERVLALEERGHRLYGLWIEDGWGFNSVGPLPFGHVEDIPMSGWREAVRALRPDVIYALLNWHAVPLAHDVLQAGLGVPFVWHFKESPFACLERGTWPELVQLYERADAQIYSSPEMHDWFDAVLPGIVRSDRALVLDGDLPKRDWLSGEPQPRLSVTDGELHTVVIGRPFGIHPEHVARLAALGIHTHFYGTYFGDWWRGWIEEASRLAPAHLHLHPTVRADRWVSELSRYDAGWLHLFESGNGGDIRRARWDDLNYPSRMCTLIAAGLPLLQLDQGDAVVAAQALVRARRLGLLVTDLEDLRSRLMDEDLMGSLRDSVWRQREEFTFDHHADRLVGMLRSAVARR
ncbi:hypothetical protein BH18CHL2_BH18CHL2_02020 [soil metagenome]